MEAGHVGSSNIKITIFQDFLGVFSFSISEHIQKFRISPAIRSIGWREGLDSSK